MLADAGYTFLEIECQLPKPMPQITSQSGVWQRVFYPQIFVLACGMLAVVLRERDGWTKGRLTKNKLYLPARK